MSGSLVRVPSFSGGFKGRVRAASKRPCCCKAEAPPRDDIVKARAEVTRRIKQLGQQGKPKQAISELTQLAQMGIQPDTQAATALISACTTNRNMDMALNVFEELFGSFVEPDDVVFAVLIRGYGLASNPPDWTAVARLLSRMQTEFDVQMTINVYNALLELCASSNDLVRAEELLDKMEAQGIMPNEFTTKTVEGKRALRSALRRTFKDSL